MKIGDLVEFIPDVKNRSPYDMQKVFRIHDFTVVRHLGFGMVEQSFCKIFVVWDYTVTAATNINNLYVIFIL